MPNYSKIAGSLSELLAKLPKGSAAAQEAIRLEIELEAARQAAMYAPHTLPTETGASALQQAKKTLGKANGGVIKMAKAGLVGEGIDWVAKALRASRAAEAGEELAKLRPRDIADISLKKEKPVPPPVPRAKPKSKEEISQIAERVAPQITGEFVRKTGKTENVAGKSRKQWDLEKELQHEMTRSRQVPEAEEISLEPHKGSVMLSLPGDTSIADYDIHSIGGVGLREPSRQYGGPRFGLGHPEEAGWASGIEPAKGFQRRVMEASKQYGDAPVLANYMAMGPEGMNYALHYSDALLKSIDPTKMTARNIDHTNRIIRAGNPAAKIPEAPDFPGIEHPEAAYLYLAENPATRKHFNAVMQLTNTTEALGLPSGLNVRHAITEPELRNLERGMTGYSLLQMEPSTTSLKPSAHPTYSHDIPGKFLGQTDIQAPYELTFPDTVAQIRANPKQAGSEFGTLQMGGGRQIIDQQLLDEIAQYRERIKQLTGKAEGGLAEGGVLEKRDVSQLFPINPNIGSEPMARTRAGVPVQDTNVLGGALQGLGETLLGAGRGYTATALGGVQDLLNMVDIPKIMTGESYQIPYGSEYFKDVLPLKPTTQTGEVAQELGSFLPVDPTQVAKAGVKTAKTVGKALAPTAAEMALDLAEKGGVPVRQFAVPPEGKLSKEEYSRMMREKYAAENAARAAKKEELPVTMADLKPKEEKVPADKLGFYSPAEKAAANLKRNIADGELMLSDLKKFPDVTPDELEAIGLEQWLKGKKTVSKQQVKDYIAKNKIELEEVKYEQGTGNADEMKFGSGEVIDDYDYISSRADDIIYDWDYVGHESRDEIRARILEDADPEDAEHLVASGKIDDLVEEEVGKLANDYAHDEYYDNPYRRYRNDMGYEIVGNDDVGYQVTDPRGNYVRMNREAYDVETAEGYARQDAMDSGYLDEGETKYHEYQLPGGENYREILLKTPSKKQKLAEEISSLEYSLDNSGNDPREVREMQKELDRLKEEYKYAKSNDYEGSHWDEPNVVAHLRLQDRVDAEGNKILYVDEMQSDWHQEGRRKGYKTKEDFELLDKAKEKHNEAAFKQNNIWNKRVERSRELAKEFADSQDPAVKALGSTKYMENDKILNDLDNAYNEASKVTTELNKELDKYRGKVPKGPFADNWHKLALKRVMKYAADNGYTRVGFSKAQPQVNRWGTDVVAWDKAPNGGWRVTATEQRGGRAGNINLEEDARARGILQENRHQTVDNKNDLYATVAKIGRGKSEEELQKLTDRIWKQMQEKDSGIVAPREAGMKKFYDEELEGALKKYANQFKGKYGQAKINVPSEGEQTINYIDITPNLKNSTTKGQPYKAGGAVKMAEGGAVNLDHLLTQAFEKAQATNLDHLLHQAYAKNFAEGGAAYNTTPDMADGGQFIQGEAF